MNTSVINIRTQPDVKKAAQQVAEDLGMNLSVLINGFLKNLIKTKTISLKVSEEPSEYLINSIKEAGEDVKNGRVSPLFENANEAIAWLNDKDKKYEYQIRKKVR